MLLPGIIQASMGIMLGYPFDTVKARMQKYPFKYNGGIQCCKSIIKNEGFRNLYKGMSSPATLLLIKRGIQYDAFEKLKYKYNSFLVGGILGGLGSIIGCPMQVIKTNMQVFGNVKYPNTYSFVKDTFKNKGIMGFYKGYRIDLLKDVIFSSSYLGLYGTLRDKMPHNTIGHFLSGGIAGSLTWGIFFPFDTIKTEMQTSNKKQGIVKTLNKLISSRSVGKLWNGVIPVLVRIFPISAISMVSYEFTRSLVEKNES